MPLSRQTNAQQLKIVCGFVHKSVAFIDPFHHSLRDSAEMLPITQLKNSHPLSKQRCLTILRWTTAYPPCAPLSCRNTRRSWIDFKFWDVKEFCMMIPDTWRWYFMFKCNQIRSKWGWCYWSQVHFWRAWYMEDACQPDPVTSHLCLSNWGHCRKSKQVSTTWTLARRHNFYHLMLSLH